MNKKIQRTIYYLFIIMLILFANYIIMLLKPSDKNSVLNNIMLLENDSLKKEINELSNINYQNYEITVPVNFKNNEVKKITFYYKKERMIKKILKLIL